MARKLAEKKGLMDDFMLYDFIETRGSQIFSEETGLDVVLPANVDLYSGFVYNALDIPADLATPIFACSPDFRMVCTPVSKSFRAIIKSCALPTSASKRRKNMFLSDER